MDCMNGVESAALLANSLVLPAALQKSIDQAAQLVPEAAEAVQLLSKGAFIDCLRQPCIRRLLEVSESDGVTDVSSYFATLKDRVAARVKAGVQEEGTEGLAVTLLAGVASLKIFIQHNLTGPLSGTPELRLVPSPIQLFASHIPYPDILSAPSGLGTDGMHPHERWAAGQLELDGEDLIGKCAQLQYLLLAQHLLLSPLALQPTAAVPTPRELDLPLVASLSQRWKTWAWWALRVCTYQQSILAGRSATLLHTLNPLRKQLVDWADEAGKAAEACGNADSLERHRQWASLLHLELAQVCYTYGLIDPAQKHMELAGQLLGLSVELTGAMGMRTVHQVDAKAQLVVMAHRSRLGPNASDDVDISVGQLGLGNKVVAEESSSSSGGAKVKRHVEVVGLSDESDVFMVPKLVGEGGEDLECRYSSAEQALLLGCARHVKKATANDNLKEWDMAPYVEAVLQQEKSQYMVQANAKLLKIRHDLSRNRTRERALMQMEQLCDFMALPAALSAPTQDAAQAATPSSAGEVEAEVAMRMRAAFVTNFPLTVGLKKELAQAYVAMGIPGAAITIYEELELWDALVVCYRLLQKKQLAEEVVQRQLKVHPNDPKLWCILGDLHENDAHYLKAWELSNHRHARSKRSLGHSAMRRKEWKVAAEHYKASLALSPLYPSVWFALGYAYVKSEEPHLALKAFSTVTRADPDHAEAWNNIAALWGSLRRPQEAFSAHSQCVKFRRDSWQVWENYSRMALESGNLMSCVRGLKQVMHFSQGQRLDSEVVEGLLSEIQNLGLPKAERRPRGQAHENCWVQAESEDEAKPEEVDDDDVADLAFDIEGLMSGVTISSAAIYEERASEREAKAQEDAEIADVFDERDRQQLLSGVGSVLKEGANSPACNADTWGLLGRYYRLCGERESEKEALLKQVRSLSSTGFKSDAVKFEGMAKASLALCHAYMSSYKAQAAASEGAPKSMRDLSAARMHLKGILKQCELNFSEHELYSSMAALLADVEAEEQAARS